ncbi:VAMP-associated protein [Hypoxylon fragiforme]|uniref:VAMP-associated protein n=1 Tax=Hypoxylon fragiforme TaxID=63214 RepID=UPI0020C5B4B9|nr:VAMP-associated protein [Hypoxylon fragiforme]KAI2606074.1 VAMP-associated protein [Hypoxylon fragiforme]
MSLEIDPQELGFHRPFTSEVSEVLRIRNSNTHPVAFKVKTTAPKQYCVRPNAGRIEPGKEVEVSVILQAMKQEPPPDTKCRDKFLVQSIPITGDMEFSNLTTIWAGAEKSAVLEKKIRVIFMPPHGAPGASHLETPNKPTTNGSNATPEVPPPAYSSPADFSAGAAESQPAENKDITRERTTSAATAAAVATTQHSDPSPDELKQQLLQAERMIAQLKQDQEGLRQRKATSTDNKTGPKPAELSETVRAGTEGVPVKLAAILCFLSFMLAYLFF